MRLFLSTGSSSRKGEDFFMSIEIELEDDTTMSGLFPDVATDTTDHNVTNELFLFILTEGTLLIISIYLFSN